jgi:hypothetical protein
VASIAETPFGGVKDSGYELAAVDDHGFGRRPSLCAGVDFADIWNPRVASELRRYP